MASQEERMLILNMIDEGKISADEGARLLAAMRPSGGAASDETASSGNARSDTASRSGAERKAESKASAPPQDNAAKVADSFKSRNQGGSMHINVTNVELDDEESLSARDGSAKNLRVRVSDPDSDQDHVNVNVPLKFVEFGLRFLPDTNDSRIESLRSAVNKGKAGRVLNIKDDSDVTRVEVSLE